MISGEYISAAGAVSVAALAWLGGRYMKSGRIRTSEAEQLWRAAEVLREEGRKDREALRGDISVLRARVETGEQEIVQLQKENRRYENENYTLTQEVRRLKARIGELEAISKEKP